MPKDRLRLASDAAVVVIAIVLVVVVASRYLAPERPNAARIKVGQILPGWEKMGLGSQTQFQLLIVVKRGCQFCEGSTPFYRELAQMEQDGRTAAHVVAVSSDSAEVLGRFLSDEQLNLASVANADPESLGIGATPTLILVQGQGKVVRVWEGLLSRKAEADVRVALSKRT